MPNRIATQLILEKLQNHKPEPKDQLNLLLPQWDKLSEEKKLQTFVYKSNKISCSRSLIKVALDIHLKGRWNEPRINE